MYLLLTTDENKSYYIYIKDFNRFMCNKTRNKNKKHFCKYCLQFSSGERVLVEHKKIYFMGSGVVTKIILDTLKNIKHVFLAVLLINIASIDVYVYIDDIFSKPVVLYRGKNAVYRFIKAILEEYYHCKNVLIKILSCLQKMKKGFKQALSAGYVIII